MLMLPAIHKHVVRRLDCGLRADPRSASLHTGACTHSRGGGDGGGRGGGGGGGEGKGNGAVVAFGFAFDSIERALSSLPAPRVCTKPEPRDTPVSASREPVDTIREAEAEKRSKPRYAASLGRRDWWPATAGQRADKERRGGFVTFAFPLSFFPEALSVIEIS